MPDSALRKIKPLWKVDGRDANSPQPLGIVTNINPPKTGAAYATANQCGACLLKESAGAQ
jgi:hypothetical protein